MWDPANEAFGMTGPGGLKDPPALVERPPGSMVINVVRGEHRDPAMAMLGVVLAQVYQRFDELVCNQRVAGGRGPLWHYKVPFAYSGNGSGQMTVRRVPPGLGSMPSAS